MILSGAKCTNIDDFLVYSRTNLAMIGRRGEWSYFLKYKHGRDKVLATGFIGWLDYWKSIIPQFIISLVPSRLRIVLLTNLLR